MRIGSGNECDYCQEPISKFEINTRCFKCDLRYQLDRIADCLEWQAGRQ